jgi:hypothetical protein
MKRVFKKNFFRYLPAKGMDLRDFEKTVAIVANLVQL